LQQQEIRKQSRRQPEARLVERINLSVSQKSPDDGKNGQILYATVSATNSNPTDTELVPVRIRISDLPEGVTLTGFEESDVMQVTYKAVSETTEETLEVKLVEEDDEDLHRV